MSQLIEFELKIATIFQINRDTPTSAKFKINYSKSLKIIRKRSGGPKWLQIPLDWLPFHICVIRNVIRPPASSAENLQIVRQFWRQKTFQNLFNKTRSTRTCGLEHSDHKIFPNLSQSTLRFVTGPAVTWRKWFRHWNMSRPVPSFQQPNDWNDLKPTTRCNFARKHKQPSRSSINIFHHLNNTEPLGAAFQFSPLTAAIGSMIDFSVISFLPTLPLRWPPFAQAARFLFFRQFSPVFSAFCHPNSVDGFCTPQMKILHVIIIFSESFSHLNSISLKMATRRQWTTLEHFFKKIKFSC